MKVTLIAGSERVVLGSHPFTLLKNINLSGLSATINIAETGNDGGLFLNSRLNSREIELEGMIDCYQKDEKWIKKQRDLVFKICNPKQMVKIEVESNSEIYYLEAYPVSYPVFQSGFESQNKKFHSFLLQFTAPDPYLYRNKKIVTFAKVTPLFKFPIRFSKVRMGLVNETLIQNIYNAGSLDAPIEMTIEALQTVTKPYMINVYTQEKISFNTTLQAGDKVIVNTGRKTEVSKISGGIKTNFYYALDLESDFIQLNKGDNIFRFGADSGEESMRVQVAYNERLGGI
jgi:hypothetical protein